MPAKTSHESFAWLTLVNILALPFCCCSSQQQLCKYVSSPDGNGRVMSTSWQQQMKINVGLFILYASHESKFRLRVKVQKPLRPCNCELPHVAKALGKHLARPTCCNISNTNSYSNSNICNTATALPAMATHFSRPKVLEAFCCPLRDEGLSVALSAQYQAAANSLSGRLASRQAATKRLRHTSDCRFCPWRVLLQLQLPQLLLVAAFVASCCCRSCCWCCYCCWLWHFDWFLLTFGSYRKYLVIPPSSIQSVSQSVSQQVGQTTRRFISNFNAYVSILTPSNWQLHRCRWLFLVF